MKIIGLNQPHSIVNDFVTALSLSVWLSFSLSLNLYVSIDQQKIFVHFHSFPVIDSNGRLPSGLLSGTTSDLGDYQQCLDIELNKFQSPFDDHFSSNSHPPKDPIGGHSSGHISSSDEGSLRPSDSSIPSHSLDGEINSDEVIVTSSDQSSPSIISSNDGGHDQQQLQGQYCLMSFKPLLPNLIQGENDGSKVIGNQKIQSLIHSTYTDTLSLQNKSLDPKVSHSFISND